MLLGRIFRVALGSAQGAGAIRCDTFPEPPESFLPTRVLQRVFPTLGCWPLASFPWAASRTCSAVGTAWQQHHLCIRLCLHSSHEGLGGFS